MYKFKSLLLTILSIGVTFQVEDESIKDYVFSGELGQNSLDAILSALTIVHPFNYKIEKGTVVLRK